MTVATVLPGIIPGRPTGSQQRFSQTTVTRYIAPSSGNDANAGTLAAPWKTWRRYLDYIGPAYIDGGATHTLLYLESAPASDPILTPNVGSTGRLSIAADPSAVLTVHSGIFSAVQLANPATNTPFEISDGALDWTPFAQMRVFDTSSGDIAWIFQDQGGGAARTSLPFLSSFVMGDSYVVQSVPTIGAISFVGAVIAGGLIVIADLAFASGCIVPSLGIVTSSGNSAVNFGRCHLSGNSGKPMQGTYYAESCLIVDPQWNDATPILQNVGMMGGISGIVGVYNAFVIAIQCNVQNASVQVEQGPLFVDDLAIFDAGQEAIVLDVGGHAQAVGALYGAGGPSFGALVRTGGNSVTWQGTAPTLTGAAGDASVGGSVVAWGAAPLDNFGAVIAQSV